MKKLTLFALLFTPFLLTAQVNTSLSAHLGIDFTSRNFQKIGHPDVSLNKFNYRFGFNYGQRMSEAAWFEFGFRIAKTGYNDKNQTGLRWGSEFKPDGTWEPDPTLPHEVQFVHDYLIFEIPIGIHYSPEKSKWKPFIGLALSPNIVFRSKTTEITDIGGIDFVRTTSGFAGATLSANVKAGLGYTVSKNFDVFVQPAFRYHFIHSKKLSSPPDFYNVGVEAGISLYL